MSCGKIKAFPPEECKDTSSKIKKVIADKDGVVTKIIMTDGTEIINPGYIITYES